MKSTIDRYGGFAKSIHWLTAILIVVLLGSGLRSGYAVDASTKAAILKFHIPVALFVLLLTVVRLVWWGFFDNKPKPAETISALQKSAGEWVHRLLYLLVILMLGSGLALSILSGAPDAVFGTAPLPNFQDFAPRAPHGIIARVLIAVIILHSAAALFHHFVQKDNTLRKMWFGRK